MTRCDDRRHSATPLDATTSLASLQVLEKASRELSVSLEVTQAGLEARRIAERNAKAGCLTQATPKPHPALGQAATTTTNCKQCTRTDERGKWVGHGHRLTLAPHESSRFRRSTTTPRLQ